MSERILGKDLSVYKAVSISLGQSKNENRDSIKSRFVALTLKDTTSIGAKKVSHILFEDEIGTAAFEELMLCRQLDADNKPVLDQHGGYVVNPVLMKERTVERKKKDEDGEDQLMLDTLMRWEGGMTLPYKFPGGNRYANDADNKRTTDKDGNPVIKSEIEVFVQVKFAIVKEDGTMDYVFVSGMNPNTRGERLMRTFFKVPVTNPAAAEQPLPQQAAPAEAEVSAQPAAPAGPGF